MSSPEPNARASLGGIAGEVKRSPVAAPPGGVCRFAPSPNGELHLGHAYSALINQRWSRRTGGRLLLRLEDIDRERCSPAFEAAILHDLAWLGVAPVERVPRQSERFAVYEAVLARLRQDGLVYSCFCTRGDIARAVAGRPGWPRDPDGAPLYPGTCRDLPPGVRATRIAAGAPAGLRLDMARALRRQPGRLAWREYGEGETAVAVDAVPEAWGDVLLARKTIPTSYHLAVVVDDAAQGVTDVLRGADLQPATGLHRLLQALLGLAEPGYHHHRLIRDDDGRKLSKSAGSPSLRGLRETGVTAAAVRARLGFADG